MTRTIRPAVSLVLAATLAALLVPVPLAAQVAREAATLRGFDANASQAATAETPDFSKGLLDRQAVLASLKGVTGGKYPDADEVEVARKSRIRYFEDGTYIQWAEQYTKVLTEKGRRGQTTLSSYFTIPYQRGPQDCQVTLVEIIKPDGSVQRVDVAANSKLMINPSSMGANIYNPNDKVIRVNIPGLEVGDTVHAVLYDRIVQPRVPKNFYDWIGLEGTNPILHAEAEILGPEAMPLRSIAVKDRVGQTVTAHEPVVRDGVRTYRWEARDVPRAFPEPHMPPLYTQAQRVLVSTAPSWKAISKWYWKISEPHYEPSDALKNKVAELTSRQMDRRKKIEALFQYVSQEIRYLGITAESEAPGYEPHDVADTFAQKHGVCRDKAALLVVMLRQAGIDAFPVLIHNGPPKDEEVPMPYFNHAITCVANPDGGYTLMDPTDESTRQLLPSYLNHKSYLVARPEGETLRLSPIDPAEENMMGIATVGTIDADGTLTARTVFTFDGINDNVYRGYFARSKPEDRRRYFEGAVQAAAPGAKLTGFSLTPEDMMDTSQPLRVAIDFTAPSIPVAGKTTVMLPMPSMGGRVGMANFLLRRTGLTKRRYPLQTGMACGVRETVSITDIDPAFGTVAKLPGSEGVQHEAMSWSMSYSVDGRKVRGQGDFRLKDVVYSPAEYLRLKDMLKVIERDRRKMPILTRADGIAAGQDADEQLKGDHDALVHRSHVMIDLADARNWTETRTARIEVLTYRGKKEQSELKIGYNPAWERVELVRAQVTQPDGSVREISDKEINVMDAPGAGTAPRYPTPKVFVASIPGVEVGSVIDYTYKITHADKPFFADVWTARNLTPAKERHLSITRPHDMAWHVSAAAESDAWEHIGERAGAQITDSWTAKNVPGMQREDLMPPLWSFLPTVMTSTGSLSDYAAKVHKALAKAAGSASQTAEQARELVAGKKTDFDRIEAIRNWVAINVRAAGPGITAMPLSYVTPADKTLADRYGNTSDRAVVLHAMLAAVGYEPRFVLASSLPRVQRMRKRRLSVPDYRPFGAVLVAVQAKHAGETMTVYLNDTDQYDALGTTPHTGRLALKLPAGETFQIDPPDVLHDRTEVRYAVRVKPNGDTRITRTRRYFGQAFGRMNRRFEEMTPELRRRYQQEEVAAISQAAQAEGDLETEFSKYPGTETISVSVEGYGIRDGEYLYLNLPASLEDLLWLRSDRREHPLYLASPQEVSVGIDLRFDPAFGMAMAPTTLDWTGPGGTVDRSFQPMRMPGAYGWTARANFDAALISPEEYPRLFELQRRLSHRAARLILLRDRNSAKGTARAEK